MRAKGFLLPFAIALVGPAPAIAQQVLFADDFESGLDQWTGKYMGPHSAIIVPDPFDPANHVVTFEQATSWGDIFSTEIHLQHDPMLTLRFDYLGLPVDGSIPGNYGGFIGYTENAVPGKGYGRWLAGTDGTSSADPVLIDDGSWHSYSIEFSPHEIWPRVGDVIRIHMEDFRDPPGDVYFDDVRLELVATVGTEGRTWGSIKSIYR